jgi:small subunit ribosomal protein S4
MLNKPKYKVARRLGAHIFEKTQTQKYALRAGRRKVERKFKSKSEYGNQMLEKQKAKAIYGVSERMFAKNIKKVLEKKGIKPDQELIRLLETRLDNVVYKIGFAPTRQASRQMVTHGHITINGRRMMSAARFSLFMLSTI